MTCAPAAKPNATPWCVLVAGTNVRFEIRHQDGTTG